MSELNIQTINKELDVQLSNKETVKALVSTTFKGLKEDVMRQAMLDGMLQGFTFENFLQKDVYAIPFSTGYSLVTSIDWSRKMAMRSGLAGKDAPTFGYTDEGGIDSCSVTVYRIVQGVRVPFTSLVFFSEYSTTKNLWATKPKTMIAKVAEMHALRMAFPEELAKAYTEEEVQEIKPITPQALVVDVEGAKQKLHATLSLEELKDVWDGLTQSQKSNPEVLAYKEELKASLKPAE